MCLTTVMGEGVLGEVDTLTKGWEGVFELGVDVRVVDEGALVVVFADNGFTSVPPSETFDPALSSVDIVLKIFVVKT